MHELTLALEIVEMVAQETEKHACSAIREIELEVGVLSGVDAEALEFALSVAVGGTLLEKALIRMVRTQGVGRCTPCDCTFEMNEVWTPCPICQMPAGQILSGDSLRVVSLMVDD